MNVEGKLSLIAASSGINNYSHYTSEPYGGNTTRIKSTAEVFIETRNSTNSIANGFAGTLIPPQPSTLIIEAGAKLGMKYQANTSYLKTSTRYEDINNTANTIHYINYSSSIPGFDVDMAWGVPDWNTLFPGINFTTFTGNATVEKQNIDDSSYKEILSQYEQLMNDSSYKGVNLLQQGNLKVNFNEERSSGIDIKGVDASGKALGLNAKGGETKMDILNSVDELENAVNQLRSFSAEFGNYYSIVTTREDFTENLINVLTEGADKLTLADMNAESANMLALQTRQQLAINSLSLASQAAQSVLKLF